MLNNLGPIIQRTWDLADDLIDKTLSFGLEPALAPIGSKTPQQKSFRDLDSDFHKPLLMARRAKRRQSNRARSKPGKWKENYEISIQLRKLKIDLPDEATIKKKIQAQGLDLASKELLRNESIPSTSSLKESLAYLTGNQLAKVYRVAQGELGLNFSYRERVIMRALDILDTEGRLKSDVLDIIDSVVCPKP